MKKIAQPKTNQEILRLAASGEMYSQFQSITPEKAQTLLDAMPLNRNIIQRKVNELAALIESGKWNDNHPQGLIFNKQGELIDGQHRLRAVIKTGKTVQFYCTFNADDSVKVLLDTATPRTLDQTGRILGLETSPIAIAITKALFISPSDAKIVRHYHSEQVLQIFSRFEDGIRLASVKNGSNSISVAVIRVIIARAYYHCDHPKQLEHFLEVLDTGFPDTELDSAAIALRNTYLAIPARKINAYQTKIGLYRKALTAVQKYLNGEAVKSLHEAKQQYFPLEGLDDG